MRMKLMNTAIGLISMTIMLAITVPCGAFFIGPLHQRSQPEWCMVAALSDLSEDGRPTKFPVSVPCRNAWTRLPDAVAGQVYLRRIPETGVIVALDARHMPFGIDVDYNDDRECYRCRCWALDFDLNGAPMQDAGSNYRMPPVAVKVVDGMIFVHFKDLI